LVLLFSPAATPNQIKATHLYLETVAHRGGLQLFVGQQQVAEQGERAYIQPEIPMGK